MILRNYASHREIAIPTPTIANILYAARAYGWIPAREEGYLYEGALWEVQDVASLRTALLALWPNALTWRERSNPEYRVYTHASRADARHLSHDPRGQWDLTPLIAESLGRAELTELALVIVLLACPGTIRVTSGVPVNSAHGPQPEPSVDVLQCPLRFSQGVQYDRQHYGPESGVVELTYNYARDAVNSCRAVPVVEPVSTKKRGAAA